MNDRNNRRDNNRPQGGNQYGGGGFRSSGPSTGPREMHKATCSECGNECEVPFKPTEGKPVYCRDCFNKRKPRF
ncbi:MAG: DNA-directed RNA polymerase [archaeon]|nr:DNA-directed RNA polymerase [archaeon]